MKLTQEELAERLNVTPQSVSRWENEISLPDIFVLMLSAVADSKTVQETLRLGAKGFVAKLFAEKDLLEHLYSI